MGKTYNGEFNSDVALIGELTVSIDWTLKNHS